MENHKSHIFHKKGKIDFEETFEVRSSAGVRPALSLDHCSNPVDQLAAEIYRRRACPAFAKRPGAWAGPGVAPPARCARGPLRAGAVARLPSTRVHENMTVLLLCTMYLAHTHQAQADRMRDFFFVRWGPRYLDS